MSSNIRCWVPHCNVSKDKNFTRNFFPLPKDHKYKETWLALTGKKLISEDEVYFCEIHFRRSTLQLVMGRIVGLSPAALPYYGMPQMICRTCMTTIANTALFCVVSGTIASWMPPELETDLVQCRPEPLYQILTFCIPSLNLEQNPPSLVCIKCYHTIWQYFIFKLTCNAVENRIRGSLSPEEYGKMVLCRSCPVTTGTRFFFLSEDQPMGQVFKNSFLSNYPTHIVPLRLCLKCWNLVFKLTEFHQQCLALDQVIQRCVVINRGQYDKTIPMNHVQMANLAVPLPLSSSCSSNSDSTSLDKFSFAKKQVEEAKLVVNLDSNQKLVFNVKNLKTGSEKVDSESKQNMTVCRRTGVSRVNFVEESKITLARLMLKHVKLLKPDLVPVERARRDLEMWVRVVKEFHSFGYTNTLEEIQSTWSKMKIKANLAGKVTGPMMYLDYLVYSYIIGDSVTGDGIIESEGMSNNYCDLTESTTASFSDNSIQTENYENLANSSNRHINTVKVQRPTNGLSKGDDCDIISIDDDVMVLESVSNSTNKHSENNSDKNVNSAIINNSNVNNKRDGDAGGTGQTMKALLSFRHNKVKKQTETSFPRPKDNKNKNKTKLKQRRTREIWQLEHKVELVRRMRKVYNRLIEEGGLGSYRNSPWRFILQEIATKGFRGCSVTKLYPQWGKMKVSAMTHEKNGQDIVDNEVWELLQLHNDVQKNLSKYASKKESKGDSGDKITQKDTENKGRETRTSPKRHKLLISDCDIPKISADSYESAEGNASNSTKKMVPKPQSGAVTPKRSYIHLSEKEKLEILNLIEQEFNRMLADKGGINESVSVILERLKYKNYSPHCIMYNWRKLTITASDRSKSPTPVQRKVLRLLKLYRENKVNTKVNIFSDVSNSKQDPIKKACSPPEKTNSLSTRKDQKKLDLISVIRSFGNEVFRKDARAKRMEFWVQVTAKIQAMGYKLKASDIHIIWGNMLRSAKLTWAQEGRKPRVGDQEIIDFMTEVIREKEKSEVGSRLDLSMEEDEMEGLSSCKEENNFEGEPTVSEDNLKKCEERSTNGEEEILDEPEDIEQVESSDGDASENVSFDDYDYVSFEDIQKNYRVDVSEKPETIRSEVIEILDSDEE